MVCELFADGVAQVCSPIHTYAHLVREPFGALMYTRLKMAQKRVWTPLYDNFLVLGDNIDVSIDISMFLKYRQHRCILKETAMFFWYLLYWLIKNTSFSHFGFWCACVYFFPLIFDVLFYVSVCVTAPTFFLLLTHFFSFLNLHPRLNTYLILNPFKCHNPFVLSQRSTPRICI